MKSIKKPLQVRTIQAATPRKAPVAPPVYRPQPVPLVLQRKARPGAVSMPVNRSPIIQLAEDVRGRPRERDDPRDVAARQHRSPAPSRIPPSPPPSRSPSPPPSRSAGPPPLQYPAPTPVAALGRLPDLPGLAPPVPPRLPGPRSPSPRGFDQADEDVEAAVEVDDDDKEQERDVGKPLKGFESRAIYRMMPPDEADDVLAKKLPQVHGHFWSPTKEYIAKYMKAGGKTSSSSVLIKIPLTRTYLEFLDEVAKHRELHPQNFGKAWKRYFRNRSKPKPDDRKITVKNDDGTPTIFFGKPLEGYVKGMLGQPEKDRLD